MNAFDRIRARLFPENKAWAYEGEEDDGTEGERGAIMCQKCRRWVPDVCVKTCPYCEARL